MPETCREARGAIEDLQLEDGTTRIFPLDQLRSFLKFQTITDILHCSCAQCAEDLSLFKSRTDLKSYVNDIMGGDHEPSDLTHTYYSVFSLLIFVEHPLFIIGFLDRGCNDYLLESSLFSSDSLRQYTGEYQRDAVRYGRFAKRFATNLPMFAVPHMESGRFSQYNSSVILPFVEEKEIGKRTDEDGHTTSEGANGSVFAFKIHREYNRFTGFGSRVEFARKRIETAQPLAFLERSNIQHVQQFKDPHIVKLIKAYGYGESINLIFPRAWTNLDHLLRDPVFRYGQKRGARLELANAWQQLLGISKALKKIHGFGDHADSRTTGNVEYRLCIHFDLKPDNILVEKEDGNWLITDFGQAAITAPRRRGETPRIGGHFGTDAYAPPEIEYPGVEFGRAYDIWSLGCIFLEVATFMVLGHGGLKGVKGVGEFTGLDQARQAMPTWARNGDERFFYQETPNGEFVVKKEIRDFMTSLEKRHARSKESNVESKVFLHSILDLIRRMLNPNVQDRVDISRVVGTLSSAVKRASSASASDIKEHRVIPASDEIVLGGPELNRIGLWHWTAAINEWEASRLEALENEAGFVRLHCWAPGHQPNNISFRRSDVKILPLYAFWDPQKSYDSRTWLSFLFLSANRRAEVSNAEFSFDGHLGLEEARIVHSKLTSQNIVGSYALNKVRMIYPVSAMKAMKGLFRKLIPNDREARANGRQIFVECGSATLQIWVEQKDLVAMSLLSKELQQATAERPTRNIDEDQQKVPPCRVAIYIHHQGFICTVRIDSNWVVAKSTSNDRILAFKSHPPGENRPFFASWIRPTQEELIAECPAGIPLNPKVLQYFEDIDCFKVESFELEFLSAEDRENFMWKYWETKKSWEDEWKKLDNRLPVNCMPDDTPRKPDGLEHIPVPRHKAQWIAAPNGPVSSPSSSSATTSATTSRHDSTIENLEVTSQDPTRLTVPNDNTFRRASGRPWLG